MAPIRYRVKQAVLWMGDLAVFELALIPTLFLRYGTITQHTLEAHVIPFGVVGLLWTGTFYAHHLYQLHSQPAIRLLRSYLEAMVLNLGLAFIVFYLLPFSIAPRTNLFFHFLFSLVLGYAWRVLFYRRVIERQKPTPFLYIGSEQGASKALRLLQNNRFLYTLGGLHRDLTPIAESLQGKPLFLSTQEVLEGYQNGTIRGILLDQKHTLHGDTRLLAQRALLAGLPILDLAELEESSHGYVSRESLSDAWLLTHLAEAEKAFYDRCKRALDIAVALPLGVITLLLIPIVAGITKLTSPGPLFYAQTRVGLRGTRFTLWKFRTMHLDAEKHGPQFSGGATQDPRITRFGRWMRRLRIDELPQIWNVLRGDLSLIGPRPERPEFVEPLLTEEPYYALRHMTKPGLTGWAQVQFLKPNQSNTDNLEKLQYDLYYLKHRSLILDLLILLKTAGIILRREGV